MPSIRIIFKEQLELTGQLSEGPTATLILSALPIEAKVNVWGDEHYFGIPVQADVEPGASEVVQLGDLAYWPPGNAFCIFFGQTPVSRGPEEIRAASPVNVVGNLVSVPVEDLRSIRSGAQVRIELFDE